LECRVNQWDQRKAGATPKKDSKREEEEETRLLPAQPLRAD